MSPHPGTGLPRTLPAAKRGILIRGRERQWRRPRRGPLCIAEEGAETCELLESRRSSVEGEEHQVGTEATSSRPNPANNSMGDLG